MATAFQTNAFQSNAYQENGGLTDNTVVIGINGTQEGDSGSITIVGPQRSGAPGRHRVPRVTVYIDGVQYVGDMAYIESLISLLAEKKAKEAIDKAREPKKPRIVVKPGKVVPGEKAMPVEMQIQTEVRQLYTQTYEKVYQQLEDEEEILAVLL